MNQGITIAGNLLVDHVKIIDAYPETGMLCNVLEVSRCVGGCVSNTAIDIAKLDSSVPVKSLGKIGTDADGEYILKTLKNFGIDTSGVKETSSKPTSFTDVMTIKENGARTFFHARGANEDFCYEDIEFEKLECSIFHIGYALLLDEFDKEETEYGTVMAKLLAKLRARGIKTSIDTVSDSTGKFKKVMIPSLKYCDYLIINEIEASQITDLNPRLANGSIDVNNIKAICDQLINLGVHELVVIHAPEGGWAMNKEKEFYAMNSLALPKDYIKGTVGAGDAFCAGTLYSIYKGYSIEETLKIAVSSAACNLSHSNSIDGMKPLKQVQDLFDLYAKRND